jgi:hypothetical protein
MEPNEGYKRWLERAETWRNQLADIGLDGLVASLAEAVRPLGPLAAQVLWVAQPTLGALDRTLSQEAGVLADLLHDPAALDNLLTQLTADVSGTE